MDSTVRSTAGWGELQPAASDRDRGGRGGAAARSGLDERVRSGDGRVGARHRGRAGPRRPRSWGRWHRFPGDRARVGSAVRGACGLEQVDVDWRGGVGATGRRLLERGQHLLGVGVRLDVAEVGAQCQVDGVVGACVLDQLHAGLDQPQGAGRGEPVGPEPDLTLALHVLVDVDGVVADLHVGGAGESVVAR